MFKIGILGCGGMGNCHAGSYEKLTDKAQIIAVADVIPEKADEMAKKFGAKAYYSAEELLKNEKPDIVDICLPTFLHAEYGIRAMENGCDVIIEKPLCLNSDECDALLDAQKRTGAKVQVGHVIRFWNEYVWVKNAVDSGEYGKVKSASFRRLSCNPSWGWENWFNDPEKSGTVALDLHIHDADFVRYVFGEPDKINAFAMRDSEGVMQEITSVFEYGEKVITLEGAWDYPDEFPFTAEFRVNFENALAIYEKKELKVYPKTGEPFVPEFGGADNDDMDIGINVSNSNGYYNELLYFLNCVENGNNSEIAPLSEGVKTIKLMEKEINIAGGKKK